MENSKSGNGVKVANPFKVVGIIEGKNFKNCWSDYRINRIKSAELIPLWNYKAEGLTIDQARQKLIEIVNQRKALNASKLKSGKYDKLNHPEKYLYLQTEKRRSIESFIKSAEKLQIVQDYSHYNYGNYKYQCKTFILKDIKTPYPVTATIQWSEDHDWNFYAKSYKRPKSTYNNRMVVFKTIGKLGQVISLFEYPLDSFAGSFMEKAIAAWFGVSKVKCPKELKPVQLSDFYSLIEINAINGYRLFSRYIGGLLWDYAILDTKTGTTFHAYQQDQIVPGLRNKLQAKLDIEFETITKATGFALGFCETGMRNFCADNAIDFNGEYSRRDLRNIVIQKRDFNHCKYRAELSKIGINLGK